jgi:DNA-binding SARP family transcriptional activator
VPDFRLLGPVEVSAGDRLIPLGPVKQRIVLAALLLDAGRPVHLDALVDRVWDEAPPAGARDVLYSHLSRIRHLLAEAGAADLQAQARVLAEAALAGAREAGEGRSEAESLNTLGAIHQSLAEPDRAAACHEQAVRLARRTASTAPEISALTGLARARLALGLQDAALGHAERAVSMARQVGYRLLEGQARTVLRQIQDAAPSS